jgi:dolichyl-phosphate beta-glucosyltransferase
MFNRAVRLLTQGGFSDTQCGFKAFNNATGKKLFALQRIPGFGFDVEFLYLAKKHGCRMAEVPVKWSNDPDTKVSLSAALLTFWDLVLIRYNDLRGRYRLPS